MSLYVNAIFIYFFRHIQIFFSNSKSATEGQGAEEQRLTDNKTRSEINANQAAVLSRQNSVTTSQNRENSANKVNNESELNRTSVSQRASFLQHPEEGTNEGNMARAYGKYKNSKDTPNHLYGTNYFHAYYILFKLSLYFTNPYNSFFYFIFHRS